ncbi:MAG: hypothetical protein WA966_08260 [Ornithinimicrobium sp.]
MSAYDDALARWNEYVERGGPIYARGQNTASARKFFREMDFRWREQIRALEGLERAGVKEVRAPKPLGARAKEVRLRPNGTGTVVISQCTDYTGARYERNGKVEKGVKPENLVAPLIVTMRKQSTGSDWKLDGVELRGDQSCAR